MFKFFKMKKAKGVPLRKYQLTFEECGRANVYIDIIEKNPSRVNLYAFWEEVSSMYPDVKEFIEGHHWEYKTNNVLDIIITLEKNR